MVAAPLVNADILLEYVDNDIACSGPTACITDPSVSGSNITSTYGNGAIASGYNNTDPWAAQFMSSNSTIVGDFTMTAVSSGLLTSFDAQLFNNDCEVGGNASPCTPMTWTLKESVNGGAFNIIDSFSSGQAYQTVDVNVALNQSFSAGNTFQFEVANTSGPVVNGGQAEFFDITLSSPNTAPEPSTWLLLASAFVGLFAFRARKRHTA